MININIKVKDDIGEVSIEGETTSKEALNALKALKKAAEYISSSIQ